MFTDMDVILERCNNLVLIQETLKVTVYEEKGHRVKEGSHLWTFN